MKYHFKVGDWVKHPDWDKFYPVKEIRANGFTLLMNYFTDLRWEGDASMFEVEEKEQPVKIDMNKKYRRVGTHEPVRVICVDRKTVVDAQCCVGLYQSKFTATEEVIYFNIYGRSPSGIQIIEEIPAVDWSKVKMDTPMWMRVCAEGTWFKRHFNKFEGGRVYYWSNGYTSFTCNATSDTNSTSMENCSLEEPK